MIEGLVAVLALFGLGGLAYLIANGMDEDDPPAKGYRLIGRCEYCACKTSGSACSHCGAPT